MTEEQRDNLLLSMFEALNNLDAKFDEKIDNLNDKFEKKLERYHQEVEDYHQELEGYHQELEGYHQKLERYHQEFLDKHKEVVDELERQRINLAKVENNLTDQIRALFDVKEINEEKSNEYDTMFKEIDRTLDWHNRRILRLETND